MTRVPFAILILILLSTLSLPGLLCKVYHKKNHSHLPSMSQEHHAHPYSPSCVMINGPLYLCQPLRKILPKCLSMLRIVPKRSDFHPFYYFCWNQPNTMNQCSKLSTIHRFEPVRTKCLFRTNSIRSEPFRLTRIGLGSDVVSRPIGRRPTCALSPFPQR